VRDGDALRVSRLLELDPAIARRVLHTWLGERGVPEPTVERVDAALDVVARGDAGAVLEVGGGIVLGVFGNDIRAGDIGNLRRWAARDAGLALPLAVECADAGPAEPGHDAVVVVALPVAPESDWVVRPPLPGERFAATGETVAEWARRNRVSPWLRTLMLGVADHRGLLTIPRIGDNAQEEDGAPRVRVGWRGATKDGPE
jgi:hypothetical protein